jgi:hypothetical protein
MNTVTIAAIVIAGAALTGCATSGVGPERGEQDFSSKIRRSVPSMRIGDARVVGSHVNPMGPLQVSSEPGGVAVHYMGPGRSRLEARLVPAPLEPASAVDEHTAATEEAPSREATRVLLDDGHFVLFWTRGSVETGYRALAQSFKHDGSPCGAPVVISPSNLDVVGSPRAVATDGRHVVATFAGSADGSFQVLAVPLEDPAEPGAPLTAAR